MLRARTSLDYAPALLPGAAVAALGFQAGGLFPDSWSLAAVVLAGLVIVRLTLADRPLRGLSAPLLTALVALMLLGVWMLASSGWSHAPGRAVVECGRLLTYLLALPALGMLPYSRGRLTLALGGVFAAVVAVVAAGLASRLLPDVVHPSLTGDMRRLAWPVNYWNGLGLLAAVGLLLALHFAADPRVPRIVRPLAAALATPLACALYLTLSRGAIAAGALGLVVYVVVGRPRPLVGALLSAGVPAAVAARAAYEARTLVGFDPAAPATLAEGHHVGRVVVIAMLAAAAARAVLLPMDARLEAVRLPAAPRWARMVAPAALTAIAVLAAVETGAAGWARSQGEAFVRGSAVRGDDFRTRLLTVDSGGRRDLWHVALDRARQRPLLGSGAGTFEVVWARERPAPSQALEAHSLYLETLGELGVVGFVLVALALLALVIGAARRCRGPDRALHGAVLAALATWAAHAGVDWDWELTSASIWVFGLAGAALAARPGAGVLAGALGGLPRLGLALGCALLLVFEVGVWRSQTRLADAVAAFGAGDCAGAIDAAHDSLDALPVRADPWELIADCDVRSGRPERAVRAARRAVRLDPDSWDHHYALALALAASGEDPRPAARDALRLNPFDPMAQAAVQAFENGGRSKWRRRAEKLPMPVIRR